MTFLEAYYKPCVEMGDTHYGYILRTNLRAFKYFGSTTIQWLPQSCFCRGLLLTTHVYRIDYVQEYMPQFRPHIR